MCGSVGILKHARGTVWKCEFDKIDKKNAENGILTGSRPCIIVSEDSFNYMNEHVNVLLLTSNTHKNVTCCLNINNGGNTSSIQISQPRPMRKERLVEYMGKLDDRSLEELRRKMISHFGLGDPTSVITTEPYIAETKSPPPLQPYNGFVESPRTRKSRFNHDMNSTYGGDDNTSTNSHITNIIDTNYITPQRTFKMESVARITPGVSEDKPKLRQNQKDPNTIQVVNNQQVPPRGSLEFLNLLLEERNKMNLSQMAEKYSYSSAASVSAIIRNLKNKYKIQ